MTPVSAFALFFDAGVSFVGASLLIGPASRCLPTSRAVGWLLALPFAKVGFDLVRALSADAFVTSPYAAERWELGRFQLGFGGGRPLVVALHGVLGALSHGRWYALSAGDVVGTWLARKTAPAAPAIAAAVVLAIGVVLVLRRVVVGVSFEVARRRARRGASALARARAGVRTVDVYACEGDASAPFTGGLLRPYVAVPPPARALLGDEELRAAVEHELAHVRAFDAPRLFALGLLVDLFWFAPGARRLLRLARDAAERAADAAAVRAGVDPVVLASAITRLAAEPRRAAGTIALGAAGGRTFERVRALLAPPRATSRGTSILRVALVVLAAQAALTSDFLTKL